MPVQLRTLKGKVDTVVEQQIRDLVTAVNDSEQRIQALGALPARLAADIARLQDQYTALAAQVGLLAQRIATLEAAP